MRGASPWRTNKSRVLRASETSAEEKLWLRLRDRRLGGFKFVRQFSIENFIVDFACRREQLIVEVDGGTHGTPQELVNDTRRDQAYQSSAIKSSAYKTRTSMKTSTAY
ncbi:conserved hypothetical protein [Hyphomicrobium sp. GJ21]|nr:conserved hypothetical protein [Hyphomicrobium sp. GJ21]